jgi:hypothetical protein
MMRALVACALLVAGCVTSNLTFTCGPDKSCGAGGQCVNGGCAFADTSCPTGMRYDKSAGGGHSGACVSAVVMTPDMSVTMTVDDMSGQHMIDIAQGPIDIAGADMYCKPTGAENCFDGIDNDCNGMTDCADPACNAIAECVPDESGWELGTLTAPGSPVGNNCPTHYTAQPTFVGNGINAPLTCTGCSCSGSLVCSVAISEMIATTCPNGSLVAGQSLTADNIHCDNNNNTGWNWTTQNVRVGALQTSTGCTCTGTPAPVTASFTTSNDFCETTQKGSGCNAGFVCVAKISAGQHCILQAGTTTCPGNYAAKGTGSWYQSINDQRSCGATCMFNKSGGTCGSMYHIRAWVSTNTCSGGVGADILSAGTDGCGQSTPLDSFNVTLGTDAVNPTCSNNYSATGSASGTSPQTLCCL